MKNKISYLLLFSAFLFSFGLKAQQGKDLAGVIAAAGTIVNIYTPLTVSVTAGSTNVITVGSAAGFSTGDLIYIIQMQGATVKAYTYEYGNPNQTIPNDTSAGKIDSYGSTGNNEFAQIASVSGNNITLDCNIKNTYGDSLGGVPKVQVIRVKRYSSLTINSGGSITCPAWNGSTGGVVAIEVQGTTIINSGGSIDVSGKGFRGGSVFNAIGYGTTNVGSNYGSPASNPGAHKGESIVGDTNVYKRQNNGNYNIGNAFWLSCPLSEGKCNVANGGGGGNSMNCGGGGGSNGGVVSAWNGMGNPDPTYPAVWALEPSYPVVGTFRPSSSSGGGRGGYAFSSNNQDPTLHGPDSVAVVSSVWGSDKRHNDGGWGGIPLDYSGGKVFLGGGGGAGDSNDKSGTSGGNGGGLVYLLSYGTGGVTGAGQILADGATALNTNVSGPHGDDGAGGGGGGGTVVLSSVSGFTLTNATPISAKGGTGGSMIAKIGITANSNFGPGGGGGGGYVATSSAVAGVDVSAGANGIVVQNAVNISKIATKFPPNGATSGGAGTSTSTTTFYLTSPGYTICAGNSASLTVTPNGTGIPGSLTYDWYSASAGGAPIFSGNPYNTGALTVGTYTYYAGTCQGTYRIPVVVNVLNAPTLTVTAAPTAVCVGQTTTLTASGASSYTWSANAGGVNTATATASPTVNTTYTVTGANGTCTDTKTVSVTTIVTPTVTAVASATTICSGTPVTFTASGATSYTWSANAGSVNTATATATPVASATFTVTGDNGGCPATQTVAVNVVTTPTVTAVASATTICSNSAITFTASGATSYTWSANAGGVNTATATASPTVTTTYTVTGDNGGTCTATQTVTVNVTTTPTVAIASTATTICNGTPVTFTASGATTYTWSANAGSVTTATATASPSSNTTYTVTGDNGGGCTSTQTVSVAVNPSPNVNAASSNSVICNGSNVVLTATGATSYTWSANAGSVTTATAAATPTVTTTYTVTGDSLGCTATKTVSVIVNNPPSKLDSVAVAASCNQTNGSYQINSITGGMSPYQIDFNGTGFTPIASFTYTVPNLGAGSYPVIIKDNAGCTYTTSITINNTGGITQVDSATTSAACNPTNSGAITLNSVSGGTGPYQVNVNGGTFNAIPSFPYSIPNLTAGTYTIDVKDATGCQHITQITVASLGGITQVNSTAASAGCVPPNSGSISLTSITGGTGPYQVSVNGGPYTNIPSLPYSLPNLTTGVYTVEVQDAVGCTNTTTVNVGSLSGPTNAFPTITPDTCGRSVGTINVTSVTGGTPSYQYNINGGANQASTSFTGLAIGFYTITVTDANGCMFTRYDSVRTVGPTISPTVTASGPTSFCQGGNVTLSSSIASGNTWNTTATTQTISVNTSGPYYVTLSQFGCTVHSNTITVTANANPTLTVSPLATICDGSSTTLTASGGTTYTWTPATGISSASSATVTANPTVTTVYTLTTADANNCTDTKTTTVTVSAAPTQPPLINPDTIYYCLYQTATVVTATASSGATINWYDANMNPLPSAPTPTTSILGTTTYYSTQSIGVCSSARDSITIIVIPPPNPNFVTNPASGNILAGQPVVFTPVQLPSPYIMYAWDFGDPASGTANSSASVTPTHAYSGQGMFCAALVVMSTLTPACPVTSTSCLDVLNGIDVTIPNVFSPNADNINDVFSVKTSGISNLTCNIYDRWGLKLYDWNGTAGFWDGTDIKNGKSVTDGTYYYVIEATDIKKENHKYQGFIQLIK
jgi:gliding motility-associated-like protein